MQTKASKYWEPPSKYHAPRCQFMRKHFNFVTCDKRFHIQYGQYFMTLILYSMYLVVSLIILALSLGNLFEERNQECIVGLNETQQMTTTTRTDYTPKFIGVMVLMIVFYFIDALRLSFFLLHLVWRIEWPGRAYIALFPNEIILLILLIILPSLRYSYPGQVCSGDISVLFFQASHT